MCVAEFISVEQLEKSGFCSSEVTTRRHGTERPINMAEHPSMIGTKRSERNTESPDIKENVLHASATP
jgi:hypothetical protein